MSSPPARSARMTRDVFACCSRRTTQTQSEAGNVQTDPLSPIKPEEAADATELGVEATIAEEASDVTTPREPEPSGAQAERASSERSSDDGVSLVDVPEDRCLGADATSSSLSLEDDEDVETRAVAAALAASLMAEEDDEAGGLDEPQSDVSARDRDVSSHFPLFESAPSSDGRTASSVAGDERVKHAGLAAADKTTPLLASGEPELSNAELSSVSSTSEDERALLLSVHGTRSWRRHTPRDEKAAAESVGATEEALAETPRKRLRSGARDGVGFFGSVAKASAKSVILAATTFAVCVACAAGVLTLRFATPHETVVVGPDAKALAASERAPAKAEEPAEEAKRRAPRATRAETTRAKTPRAKTLETRRSRDRKRTSKRASHSSPDARAETVAAPRTAHAAAAAAADDDMPSLGLLLQRGSVEDGCVSALGEARHGVHRQARTVPASKGPSGAAAGREETACPKCYLKGTPAETQSGSMEWCRASVCERHGVTGCAPAEGDESAQKKESRGTPTRRHGPFSSAANDAPPNTRSAARAGTKSRTRSTSRAKKSASDERTERTERSPPTARRVGRCRAEIGDADFGRFVWEDPSCETRAKHSGAGCVDQGTHHCRFCSAEARDEADADAQGRLATCPRDVCDVHNLFWELCDES